MAQSTSGDTPAAVQTLHLEFERYQDGGALLRAARMLFSQDELELAESEVDAALGLVLSGTYQWLELQRLRIEIAARRGHWNVVVAHATSLLAEEEGADSEVTWTLLFALNNLGRIPAAIGVLNENTGLQPVSEQQAQLFLALIRGR